MSKEELTKCHYVPLSSLKRALNLLETPSKPHDTRCKRNLVQLQMNKSLYETDSRGLKWRNAYQIAVARAIYSHDWDKVVYLLKKSPIWEHETKRVDEMHLWIRALTIVLMNHPSARSQGLLSDYIHMVLSCRSEQDKKAVYKSLLSLTDKLYGR